MFNFTSLKFVRDPHPHGESMRGTLVAESTSDWYAGLRELGAHSIWLVRRGDPEREDMPRHALVAFAGGGDWHLQVDYPGNSEVWSAAWHFVGKPGGGHWNVTYAAVPLDEVPRVEKHDLGDVGKQLGQALVEIEQLARANAEESWADVFKAASDELGGPGQSRVSDMLPGEGYSNEAHRLLSAASRAWVFGGMGSWNDLYFSGEEARADYNRLTARLYEAVVTAAIAATNSFERALWR
jgi:hypothetical protein